MEQTPPGAIDLKTLYEDAERRSQEVQQQATFHAQAAEGADEHTLDRDNALALRQNAVNELYRLEGEKRLLRTISVRLQIAEQFQAEQQANGDTPEAPNGRAERQEKEPVSIATRKDKHAAD